MSVAQDGHTAQAAVGPVYPSAYPSRVLLVDDDEDTRTLVRLMLEGTKRFEVVGEAEDSARGIELAGALRPDIVVLDIQMPGQPGVDAVPMIRKVAGEAKIVLFSDGVLQLTSLKRQRLSADLLVPKGGDGSAIRAALLHLTSAPDRSLDDSASTVRGNRRLYGSPGQEDLKIDVAPDTRPRNIHKPEKDIL